MNCPQNKVDDYLGIRQPTCDGGKGCPRCWAKYWREAKRRAEKEDDLRQEIANRGDC